MKFTLLFLLSFSFLHVVAQQKQFAVDEQGKYIYYEVVDSVKIPSDSLLQRARYFVVKHKVNFQTPKYTDTSMLVSGKIIIDRTVLVLGHPSGELSYDFTLEFKPSKYRFWLNQFKYIPYQRDRYGNYVATTKTGTPLEQSQDRLSAAAWKDIVESAYSKVAGFAADFKKTLATPLHIKSTVKKPVQVSTKNW